MRTSIPLSRKTGSFYKTNATRWWPWSRSSMWPWWNEECTAACEQGRMDNTILAPFLLPYLLTILNKRRARGWCCGAEGRGNRSESAAHRHVDDRRKWWQQQHKNGLSDSYGDFTFHCHTCNVPLQPCPDWFKMSSCPHFEYPSINHSNYHRNVLNTL